MPSPRRLRLALLVIAPLAAAAAEAAMQPPAGDLRPATVADLRPHPSSSKTYNEFWTYQLFLENGLQACLNFSRVNLGSFKDPVCGADLTLIGFKGRNYKVAREYDKKNFAFEEGAHRLRVHENIWLEGRLPQEHRIRFTTAKKGTSYHLELEFSEIMPGKVWGDGLFKLGSDAVGIYVHIPYAKVSGKLAINGDTAHVSGRAYMDHTFQTDLAPSLVKAGYRYVSRAAPLEVGYFLQPLAKHGQVPVGYGLRLENDTLKLRRPASLKVASAAKSLEVKVPTRLEIAFQDNSTAVLERGGDRYRQSLLEEFNWGEKVVIKRFMGGEVKTFKGVGKLDATRPAGYDFFIVD